LLLGAVLMVTVDSVDDENDANQRIKPRLVRKRQGDDRMSTLDREEERDPFGA
jgi:hypothetical protein